MVKLYGMKNGSILLKQFANVDAVLLKNGDNCFYLTEYANSDSYVLLTQKACYYLTDDRYFTEACGLLSGGYEVVLPSAAVTTVCGVLGASCWAVLYRSTLACRPSGAVAVVLMCPPVIWVPE